MRVRHILSAFALLLALGNGAATADDQALGREQVQRFFTALESGEGLEELLAESFQLIRADGRVYDRAAYLAGASVLSRSALSQIRTTRSGDTLTVTFFASFAGTVGSVAQIGEALPRLAVFEQQDGAWKMIAYANLGQGSGELQAEAATALQAFFDATYSQDPAAVRAVLAPEFQLVRSDGSAIVGAAYAETLPTFTQRAELSEIQATGFGDILVVRYRVSIGLIIDGRQAEAVSPRLTVFRRDQGTWKVVAHANFARLTE